MAYSYEGGGCSIASLLKVQCFAILEDVLKDPFKNRHARPLTESQKLRCYPRPIERGSSQYKMPFLVKPVTPIRNT